MKKHFLKLSFLLIAAILISCTHRTKNEQTTDALVSHIDSTVKPGDDFFLFANGKWFKEHPIPASEPNNGLFQLIQDTINAQIRNICESSAALKDAPKGSAKQKIGDFFFSGMDSISLSHKGISDLKDDLDKIDAIKDINGIMKVAAYIHRVSGSPLFSFWVTQDDRISSKNAIFFYQGGLSLPDRTYYVDMDPRMVMVREKFVEHAANMFRIMGQDENTAKKSAAALMKLETSLAKAARKREDTRDPLKNYNKLSFKQFTDATRN